MARTTGGRGRGVRVIAGSAGGRRLETPSGLGTRPITDRVKESVFASLGPDVLDGARVLDLYAGSGAMAVEALSRGAASATLVERDPAAASVIRRNLETVGFADASSVHRADVGRFLQRRPEGPGFTLVFCDPPYDLPTASVEEVLAALGTGWVAGHARVVLRRRTGDDPPALPAGWEFARTRQYGDTLVNVLITP
jgi:16S rRNA (guanine966-N2)-methyltransferase